MQINRITSAATKVSKKVGETILGETPNSGATKKILEKTNEFLQGEGYNPGRGAYYFIMGGCVLVPRLVQAREPDEFREILTRDATTILTILFAMKGLQSGMCSAAQKQSGLTLVKDSVGKANVLKRLGGFLNPEGGIIPLASDEIAAKYSHFSDKETFVKALKTLDEEGGSVAKMFNVESKQGIFGKIKNMFSSKKSEKPLYKAGQKIFGENFADKTNAELISAVENATEGVALEGLEDVIGSKATGIKDGVKEGILTNKDNPITVYARGVSAKFNTISLVITALFLGYGISKFNELFTAKKHLNKPGTNHNPKASQSEKVVLSTPILNSIQDKNLSVFNNFKGVDKTV